MNTRLTLTCLIVENAELARQRLVKILKEEVAIKVETILEAETVKDALKCMKDNNVDFIILDHLLRGHEKGTTGLDFLREIPNLGQEIPFVFLTSSDTTLMDKYKEYLDDIHGFLRKYHSELDNIDKVTTEDSDGANITQLNKPYGANIVEDINKYLRKVLAYKKINSLSLDANRVFIKSNQGIRIIDATKLNSITIVGGGLLTFRYGDEEIISEGTLSEFIERCPNYITQIHRSTAININRITHYNPLTHEVTVNSIKYSIGTTYQRRIRQLLMGK